jgi:hypothetical protein
MKIIKGVKPRRFKKFEHWYKKVGVDDIFICYERNRYIKSGWFSEKYSHSEVGYEIDGRHYQFESKRPKLEFPSLLLPYEIEDRKRECLNHFHSILKEYNLI